MKESDPVFSLPEMSLLIENNSSVTRPPTVKEEIAVPYIKRGGNSSLFAHGSGSHKLSHMNVYSIQSRSTTQFLKSLQRDSWKNWSVKVTTTSCSRKKNRFPVQSRRWERFITNVGARDFTMNSSLELRFQQCQNMLKWKNFNQIRPRDVLTESPYRNHGNLPQ